MILVVPAVIGLGLWAGETGLLVLVLLAIQFARAFV